MRTNEAICTSTEDMQGAYRQIPLCDTQLALAATAVYSPREKKAKLFLLYGQPFGAAHSVPNFYRVSEFLSRLIGRAFHLLLDHFFDDFFLVTRKSESEVASFCLNEAFKLLGFVLDPDKTQPPTQVSHILGVAFNTEAIRSERRLWLQPKESRKRNLTSLVDKITQDDYLLPSLAASLVGKFGFLCSTLFGKIGRCCTNSIRSRQYSTSGDYSLDASLKVSLYLMKHFICHAPSRSYSLKPRELPVLLYTDASDVPEREAGRFILGAVLISPHSTPSMQHTYWQFPQSIVDQWITKATYMNQLEILAGPLAMQKWLPMLAEKQVIHFVDNDGAASSLVKGYSPKTDSCALCGSYWIMAASHKVESYIERVESKSNLADGPSRLDFSLMQQFSSVFIPPKTDSLGSMFPDFHRFFDMVR